MAKSTAMKCVYPFRVVLLTILFLMPCIIACAQTSGDFEYKIRGSEVAITFYTGTSKTVIIPAEINGMPVTEVSLSHYTVDNNPYVHKIILPDSVVRLGDYAFRGFSYLESIEGLEHIQYVGDTAFCRCYNLTSASFSDDLAELGYQAFYDSGFRELIVPDDIILTGYGQFAARHLKSITLIRGSGEPTIVQKNDVLFSPDYNTLICYPSAKPELFYEIPEGTTSIRRGAFCLWPDACTVSDILFPSSVTEFVLNSIETMKPLNLYLPANSSILPDIEELNIVYPSISYEIYESKDSITTIDHYLDEIVDSKIDENMTDIQKAYAIVDWLAENVVYDSSQTHFGAYDLLKLRTGVCSAYAEVFKLLMDKLGIPCKVVAVPGHEFNAISIEGEWIYIDPTESQGDDPLYRYRFFGFDDSILDYYYGGKDYDMDTVKANTCRFNYYYTAGILDPVLDLLRTNILEAIENNTTFLRVDIQDVPFLVDPELCCMICASIISESSFLKNGQEISVTCMYYDAEFCINIGLENDDEAFNYSLRGEYAVITGYLGHDEDIVIPATIGGYAVGYIGNAFTNNSSIHSVELPDTIVGIDSNAFYSCISLESINFPPHLVYIGVSAFEKCYLLNCNVEFTDELEQIGKLCFGYCYSLTSVTIPESVQIVDDMTFLDCKQLKSIDLQEGVLYIAGGCFSGCRSLNNIALPASLEYIGNGCFTGTGITSLKIPPNVSYIGTKIVNSCEQLSEITVDHGNSYYAAIDGILYKLENDKPISLKAVPKARTYSEIVIPDTVLELEEEAFNGSMNVYNVKLSSALRTIGDSCFRDCQNIEKITFSQGSHELKWIGDSAFALCYSLSDLWLPDSVEYIGRCAFNGTSSVHHLNIPKSMTELDPYVQLSVKDYIHVYVHDEVVYLPAFDQYGYPCIVYVHGKNGTYAQTYAEENEYVFVANETELNDQLHLSATVVFAPCDQFTFSLETWTDTGVAAANEIIWASSNPSVVLPEKLENGITVFHTQQTGDVILTAEYHDMSENVIVHAMSMDEQRLPASLTSIDNEAFFDTFISYLDFRNTNNLSISADAFAFCKRLHTVILGDDTGFSTKAFNNLDNGITTVFCANSEQAVLLKTEGISYAIWH